MYILFVIFKFFKDYGLKVNFKRKKIKLDVFTGLLDFSRVLYKRMKLTDILKDFEFVE